jgi:hypothetical protein
MEGFDSEHRAASVVIVGNKSIATIDDAARCVVQEMLTTDEQQKKIKFSFGSFFEFENSEVIQNFRDRHHLSVAMRTLKAEYLDRALDDQRLLIIAIDEAEMSRSHYATGSRTSNALSTARHPRTSGYRHGCESIL